MRALAALTLTVRVADFDATRLFIWQLHELRSRMTLVADPFASELDQVIDRYASRFDDERSTAMTDDLEKQADETEPEAEPGSPIEEPSDGEAGNADAESGVEPEAEERARRVDATATSSPTVEAAARLLPRLDSLLTTASDYGLEATAAEIELQSPAAAYIGSVLAGMADPEMTLVAGNIRHFWALILEGAADAKRK